jgi:hypothetical protein
VSRTAAGGPRATVAAHGLRVTLPDRWEARLYRRDATDGPEFAAATESAGESNNPVLHLANFALPPGRGDFGTGAVEVMGPAHAFVSLLEYDAEEAGQALFATQGRPRLTLRDFAPNALQRRLPGQLGCQKFFTENGRPFCLYVVLGSRHQADQLIAEVERVLANLEVVTTL